MIRRVSKVACARDAYNPAADGLGKRVDVFMGPQDGIPACHEAFYTLEAAQRFAAIHHGKHPDRVILVRREGNFTRWGRA